MNVDVVRFPTADVKLSRPRFDDISGSDVTALRLWPAAVPLAAHLHERVLPALRKARGGRPLRILELGAGRGLVGLAISALGGDEVVLTDDGASLVSDGGASKSAIDVLRENIALNAGRARAAALRWGDDAALRKLEPKRFDCVVGSDLLYDPSSYTSLLKTLEACGCEAHIAITRRHAGERAFFALAERRFDVVATTPLRWPADVRRPDANAGPFVVPLERVRRGERLRSAATSALGALYGRRRRQSPAPEPPPRDCADEEWATFETAMVAWAVEQGSVQNAEAGWRPAGRGDAVVHLRPKEGSHDKMT